MYDLVMNVLPYINIIHTCVLGDTLYQLFEQYIKNAALRVPIHLAAVLFVDRISWATSGKFLVKNCFSLILSIWSNDARNTELLLFFQEMHHSIARNAYSSYMVLHNIFYHWVFVFTNAFALYLCITVDVFQK